MSSPLRIRKDIVIFSSAIMLLLLWLSISFLHAAYEQFTDAQFLQSSLEREQALNHAAISLAEERGAIYWLTAIDGLFFAGNSLKGSESKTDASLKAASAMLEELLTSSSHSKQLTYQKSHLVELFAQLQHQRVLLAVYREALKDDLKLPLANRDRSMQLYTFDFYGQMIDKLRLITEGIRFVPKNNSREMQRSMEFNNAAWGMGIASRELTSLFEAYIVADNKANQSILGRTTNLENKINNAWLKIEQMDAYNKIDSNVHSKAIALTDTYVNAYRNRVKQMNQAIKEQQVASLTNWDWKKLSGALQERIDAMMSAAEGYAEGKIEIARIRATRNLGIDCVLVFLSLGLMFAAVRILRQVHHQATHDALTGIHNRRWFESRSKEIINTHTKDDSELSMLHIDLYKFKTVNDTLGQMAGDVLLKQVADRVQRCVGSTALLARMGADEYCVLLNHSDGANAQRVAEAICNEIGRPFNLDGQSVKLNCCVGIAVYPHDGRSSEELRKAADLALFDAKNTGPGSIAFYKAALATAFLERQRLESDLAVAIEHHQFELHYQPQFDLERGVVDGVEALLRWNHPTRGMVSPFHFIPVAEDAGLLPAIGQWVIEEAVQQAVTWDRDMGLQLRMSVNVSVHQFLHGDIVEIITSSLQRHGLNPHLLEIEITESVAMAELELVLEKLEALRGWGIRIALDDFGTGYSSLSYLQDLPLDTLKIDRSFITKLDGGTRTQRILVESIASMAQSLDFHTVAEGVETDAQLQQVRALGIDTVQGYYYSKPVTADAIPGDVENIDLIHGLDDKKAA